ncbi:GtrA family protein [Glaciimonas soli]|nr:GtrA family protein [Glaciimonas soli]
MIRGIATICRRLPASVLGFMVVGGIGFVVDACVMMLLYKYAGLPLYLSRVLSFLVAVFVTWLLNRSFVFASKTRTSARAKREYVGYLAVQTAGALLNLGIFSSLIAGFPGLRTYPVIALMVGSGTAMIFNYYGLRHWVFGPAREH